MFKTAPRYLSGVSVFYGDDVTAREIDGEIVVVVGPAFQGPSVPLALKAIDNSVSIYGTNNPLVKAAYQFWDGYTDSVQNTTLRLVTMRIGGISAALTTSYGLSLNTTDAYDGIEKDFFIYVDNTSAANAKVKIWDTNKQIVFDSQAQIDTQHITVSSLPNGNGGPGAIYGKDLDNDPLSTPVAIKDIVKLDHVNPTGKALTPKTSLDVAAVTLKVTADANANLIPNTGTLVITGTSGAITYLAYVNYTDFDGVDTFVLDSPVAVSGFTGLDPSKVSISFVGSVLVAGDSQLNLSKRETYELMRNALQEIEQYTPDYIIPAGVAYNDTETYVKTNTANTLVTQPVPSAATGTPQNFIVVDAAYNWPISGQVVVSDGAKDDILNYTAVTVVGTEDYRLDIATPSFGISAPIKDATIITVSELPGGAKLTELTASGYVRIDAAIYSYVIDPIDSTKIVISPKLAADAVDVSLQKVIGEIKDASAVATRKVGSVTIGTTWLSNEAFELGIGFVQEIDKGDHFDFKWSDVKLPGYFIAHFGFLFGNFCNEAAVGYNTPLCGMNVALPTGFSRTEIIQWIGKAPQTQIVAGTSDAVQAITMNGTGLLGDSTLAGSVKYNRCYMSDPANNDFADPAFGILMTDEGFIDGHEIKDDYAKVVDLGKFVEVGAGLLTFTHRASGVPYIDACGVYALGLLAGTPKNEGISFKRIGIASNTTVGVVVHRKLYNDLCNLGYIVVTREKSLGWVINNDNSVARNQSGYYLISTTRTVKAIIESKRSVLVSFIGKPINRYFFEAAKTKVADSFKTDMANGYLTGYTFDLQISQAARAIGKLYLKCSLNPPLELVQVDIDTVIDRNVTTGA